MSFLHCRNSSLPMLVPSLKREAGVVTMRFGMMTNPSQDPRRNQQVYGVTRRRIRQIEVKTISGSSPVAEYCATTWIVLDNGYTGSRSRYSSHDRHADDIDLRAGGASRTDPICALSSTGVQVRSNTATEGSMPEALSQSDRSRKDIRAGRVRERLTDNARRR